MWPFIRELWCKGASYRQLASLFNVSFNTIKGRALREGWKREIGFYNEPRNGIRLEDGDLPSFARLTLQAAAKRALRHIRTLDPDQLLRHATQIRATHQLCESLFPKDNGQIQRAKNGRRIRGQRGPAPEYVREDDEPS
jgi:hypothetical protein